MPKQGSEFETLTAEIFEALKNDPQYESVEQNVMLEGSDGPREIDVLLRGKVGPFDMATIIECKDYNKNIDVTTLDAFDSKLRDINANKGILVARKGFSKTARQKAARVGITLCTAHRANSEKWKFDLQIPFIINELEIINIQPRFRIPPGGWRIEELDLTHINDTSIHQLVANHWNDHELPAGKYTFKPFTDETVYLKKKNGDKIPLPCPEIDIHISPALYQGHFNQLDSSKLLKYIEEETCSVIFDTNELIDYRSKAPKFRTRSDLPDAPGAIELNTKLIIQPQTRLPFQPSARKFLQVAKQAT